VVDEEGIRDLILCTRTELRSGFTRRRWVDEEGIRDLILCARTVLRTLLTRHIPTVSVHGVSLKGWCFNLAKLFRYSDQAVL